MNAGTGSHESGTMSDRELAHHADEMGNAAERISDLVGLDLEPPLPIVEDRCPRHFILRTDGRCVRCARDRDFYRATRRRMT